MKSYNIQLVQRFYKEVLGNFNFDLAEEIITEDYIQHNPQLRTGREGVIEAISYLKSLNLPKAPESPVKFIFEEGDLVAAMLLVKMGENSQLVMDLFRIEGGKLAEHWDCIQALEQSTEEELFVPTFEVLGYPKRNTTISQDLLESLASFPSSQTLGTYLHPEWKGYFPEYIPNPEAFLAKLSSDQFRKENFQVHRTLAQGNFVFLQSSFTQGELSYVANDLLAWQGGQVRCWYHIQQRIPEQMRHENGMI